MCGQFAVCQCRGTPSLLGVCVRTTEYPVQNIKKYYLDPGLKTVGVGGGITTRLGRNFENFSLHTPTLQFTICQQSFLKSSIYLFILYFLTKLYCTRVQNSYSLRKTTHGPLGPLILSTCTLPSTFY